MKPFSYDCHTRIELGDGISGRLPQFLRDMETGKRVLLVTDPGVLQTGLVHPMEAALTEAGYHVTLFHDIVQNPRDTDCVVGAGLFRDEQLDAVVAVGGGSAMDTGKAIALLGPSGGTPADYVDGGRSYGEVASLICVPTTAGTGSEVTRSAVITESVTHRKMTLKHASLRPSLAILDPRLTVSVPTSVTAATGVDALVHAIEGYSCRVTNPISQALGARAMKSIVRTLPLVYADGSNLEARSDMLEASLLAGLCFGSADVAAVHCLAEALGGLYDTPHGVANAVFLPHVLRYNAVESKAMHAEMARIMGLARDADADEVAIEKMVEGIERFTDSLGIPKLMDLPNVRDSDFVRLAELAEHNGSTPSNVRTITRDDYLLLLETAAKQR